MSKKSGLGRGLDALIPLGDHPVGGGILLVDIEQISRNPRQPRARIDPQELDQLAASIQEHGILQPLIVTHNAESDEYILIAGERRLLAAQQAGLSKAPVIVREASDQQRLELALVENLQREDLNPLEAAEAYRHLAEDFGLSHEEISVRVAKSRVSVTNTLRLLKLPTGIQQALLDRRIAEGHARALLALNSPQAQAAALHTIIAQDMTVRQAEVLVKKLSGEKPAPKSKPLANPEVRDLQERLEASLGTRVQLNPSKNGGTLVIHYYSNEELEALVEKILGEIHD